MPKVSPTATFSEKVIDEVFREVDQSALPGAAVAIAIGGVPVYRKGFGLAHMELPTVLTPTMRMRIASTTKHFTCLAYMLLCEMGKASPDDEISRYVPELRGPMRGVTLRQLMGHTSGVRDIVAINWRLNGNAPATTDLQMLADYTGVTDVDFPPGARWSYNNGGYVLLTIAIERIAGQSLDSVLRERVFAPVGMFDTMMRRWDTDFVSNSATMHTTDGAGGFGRDYIGVEQGGGGGVVSTMDDMLRWLAHMDSPVVGTAATWALMRQPHTLSTGASTGYGLGLRIGTYRGVDIIHHSGGIPGANSQMIKAPSVGLDISVAVNRSDLDARLLANQIIDRCVEGLEPVGEQNDRHQYTGVFLSRRTGRVVELRGLDGRQIMSVGGAAGVPVFADEQGVLRLSSTLAHLKQSVVVGAEGIEFSEFGDKDLLDRVEVTTSPKDRSGHFVAALLDGRARVHGPPGGERLAMSGRHGCTTYKLDALSSHIWRATPFGEAAGGGFLVVFDPDGGGLELSGTQASNFKFARVVQPEA